MSRRDFITLIGGATATWPLAARAQPRRLQTIGYLSDEVATPHLLHSHDSIMGRLRELGYVNGKTVAVHYRYAEGNIQRLPSLAAELTSLPVDVILAIGTPAASAAIAATKTIPIIFARIGDPVGFGLVTSLARPEGNATGVSVFSVEIAQKRLELLREQVPGLSRVAVLTEPNFPAAESEMKEFTSAAASLHIEVQRLPLLRDLAVLGGYLIDIQKQGSQALFVGSSGWFEDNYRPIVDFSLKTRLPALFVRREYVEIGGMMAYAIDYREMYHKAADYIVKILKDGRTPADLPVQQATKIELVLNLKTAKSFNLEFPPALLIRADEMIE